jgi:hypothetical protein
MVKRVIEHFFRSLHRSFHRESLECEGLRQHIHAGSNHVTSDHSPPLGPETNRTTADRDAAFGNIGVSLERQVDDVKTTVSEKRIPALPHIAIGAQKIEPMQDVRGPGFERSEILIILRHETPGSIPPASLVSSHRTLHKFGSGAETVSGLSRPNLQRLLAHPFSKVGRDQPAS